MKFSAKYPRARYLKEVEPSIVKDKVAHPCWNCKEETFFFDIDFGAHLCSDECAKAKRDEYESAMRGTQ